MNKTCFCDFDFEAALAKRGSVTKGYFNVACKPDGSWVRFPIIVVSGIEEGPRLLVDGAHHGDEYEGVQAIIETANALDPKKLKGTFIGVPVLNMEAFMYGNRISPMDYSTLNLNRAYPGTPEGFITSRIVDAYLQNIVKKSTHIITFHGGGDALYLDPLASYIPGNDSADASYRMAKAFGVEILWRMEDVPFGGFLNAEAAKLGIPCITPEVGSQSIQHPYANRRRHIDICATGIANVMKSLRMIEGDVVPQAERQIDITLIYLCSNAGGIHVVKKMPVEPFVKGEVLAEIFDVFGDKVGETLAPEDGVMVGYGVYPVVLPGNWSILYGRVNS